MGGVGEGWGNGGVGENTGGGVPMICRLHKSKKNSENHCEWIVHSVSVLQ